MKSIAWGLWQQVHVREKCKWSWANSAAFCSSDKQSFWGSRGPYSMRDPLYSIISLKVNEWRGCITQNICDWCSLQFYVRWEVKTDIWNTWSMSEGFLFHREPSLLCCFFVLCRRGKSRFELSSSVRSPHIKQDYFLPFNLSDVVARGWSMTENSQFSLVV